jgi:hypothetical protein
VSRGVKDSRRSVLAMSLVVLSSAIGLVSDYNTGWPRIATWVVLVAALALIIWEHFKLRRKTDTPAPRGTSPPPDPWLWWGGRCSS